MLLIVVNVSTKGNVHANQDWIKHGQFVILLNYSLSESEMSCLNVRGHLRKYLYALLLLSMSCGVYAADTDGDGVDDSTDNCVSVANSDQTDTDSDSLGNACDADDDGDNVIDSQDAFPLNKAYFKDSDNDQIPDKYEVKVGLNPNNSADAALDVDGDGLTALEEFGYGTDHRLKDTDRDTLPDNWELQNARNPLKPDYVLSDPCFVSDGVNMCWKRLYSSPYSTMPVFPEKDGLIFEKLLYSVYVYCGLSSGNVHCWSDKTDLDETNGLGVLDVPNFEESIIDIANNGSQACALTNTKRVVCWGYGDEYGSANDQDRDGVLDIDDVCTQFPSTNQNDQDGDGLGDECDADADGNGTDENTGVRSMTGVNRISMGQVSSDAFSWARGTTNKLSPLAFAFDDSIEMVDQNGGVACAVGSFAFMGDGWEMPAALGYSKSGDENFECWAKYPNVNTGDSTISDLPNITDFAMLGGGYKCVISSGEVVCAGRPITDTGTFPDIPPLTNPVRLVSAGNRFCALHDKGISCWGEDIPYFNFPHLLEHLEGSTEVQQIAGATCINQPILTCWGVDYNDQLTSKHGYLARDFGEARLLTSGVVPSGNPGNSTHQNGCAVDGQDVKCWGGTQYGSTSYSVINRTVLSAPTGSEVVDLEFGSNMGCVLLKLESGGNNEIKCWDSAEYIEADVPSYMASVVNPIDIAMVPISGVAGSKNGRFFACALSETEISCGSPTYYGSPLDSALNQIELPEQVFNAKKLSVSGVNICVLEQRGVLCWGNNEHGQSNTVALLNPRDIYAAGTFTCALHDPGVKCWGKYNFDHESLDIRGKIGHGPYGPCVNDGGALLCMGSQAYDFSSGRHTGDMEKLDPFLFYSFDPDGDGFHAWEDDFPLDALETADYDLDGIGNNADTDDDNDGISDDEDGMPFDTDNDGLNNDVDYDDDSDGILDVNDGSPLDTDNDTLTNDIDTDDDNDGYPDSIDDLPLDFSEYVDTDSDGIGNNADTDDDGDGLNDDYDAFPLDASEQVDTDSDGIGDNGDNCPMASNSGQINSDDDSLGDSCDPDDDNDGVADGSDAFPLDAAEQVDTDSDGTGNNADTDDDGDGVSDALDVFPLDGSETIDTDLDGIGNNADTDDDGDNVPDNSDAFPLNASEWADTDLDGIGNNADTDDDGDGVEDDSDAFPLDVAESVDTDSDGIGNNADTDDDGDTYADNVDVFPLDSAEWLDTDSDGTGNNADTDDDNDGVLDGPDAFPLDASESIDTDSDGIGNNADTDDDGDSILDVNDAFPLDNSETVDTDSDGIGNNTDTDDDNDGISDALDMFPLDNSEWVDTDTDGIGNNADTDDDNDGIPDSQEIEDGTDPLDAESLDTDRDGVIDSLDLFPLDSTEWSDSDSDGIGNNTDIDDDNDGVADNTDAFPLDSTETVDTDLDGIGNNADTDDDGDGAGDLNDAYPLNSLYSKDTDLDGMPDAWEIRYGLDPNDPSDATSDQDNDGVTALDEFLADTIPSGSIDLDGNERYDALTDGLLLLRGMFGLDGSALVTGTIASDAAYIESVDIESRIATLGDLADIDGNGDIDALTDGLLTLRYLFGLQGDTLINGVVADDATRTTAEEIEAHLDTLMPAL